jgi:SynChlorMet cassette protein ScmC
MKHLVPQSSKRSSCELSLSDGSRWTICAEDEQAAPIVSRFRSVLQLSDGNESFRKLLVVVDDKDRIVDYCGDNKVCVPRQLMGEDGLHVQLIQLSMVIAREVQSRGGVLLHGALAERDGAGVILAAPAGTGKTTASERLPSPWESLCDDVTLVVRDAQGNYRAHPWPTWSRFMWGGPGGSWDVQHSVSLKAIFFLDRATENRVESVGPGQAVSLLVECAQQGSMLMTRGLSREKKRSLHLERFDNLCALGRTIPSHILHISLTGAFWQEIEHTLQPEKGEADGSTEKNGSTQKGG